jgi:Holliday junction resolvasome RuvABC DNA-binding subunit
MTYTILEGNGDSAETFETENTENAWFEALNYLGYSLKYDTSIAEEDVKEYIVLDNDGLKVLSFFETFVENACVYALTDLGYSVEEGDLMQNKIIQVSF